MLVAVGGLAFGLHRSSSHPTINQEVLQIAGEVRCPVCNGETAAQSQAAASVQIRAQILRELQSGETKDQILDGLVQAYGTGILEKPQPTGVGLVVWVVPVVAILVAAGVLSLAFARWRAKAAADGSDSSGAMDTLPGPERVVTEPVVRADSVPASTAPPAGLLSSAAVVERSAERSVERSVESVAPGSGDGAASPSDEAVASRELGPTGGESGESDPAAVEVGPSGAPIAAPPAAPTAGDGLPAPGPIEPAAPDESPGRSGPGKRPARRPVKTWKKWAVAGAGLALIAGGASWALVASTSTRLAGQTITGQALGPEVIESDLNQADNDLAKGNVVGAIKEYQKILASDPTEPEALTGEGWTLASTGDPTLLQQGLKLLASAEQSNPTYAPAHVYRGLALLSEDDYADSVPELKWYLAHSPDPQLVSKVRTELQQAEVGAAAEAKASAGSTGPSSTGAQMKP